MLLKGFLLLVASFSCFILSFSSRAQIPRSLQLSRPDYKEPKIKILLKKVSQKQKISVKGFALRVNHKFLGSSNLPKWSHYSLGFHKKTKKWILKNEKTQEVLYEPQGHLSIEGESVFINHKKFPKSFKINPKYSYYYFIEEKALEKYLEGVIPSEMPASWPREALKAQVVASRTYALYQMKKYSWRSFHIESGVNDQVYKSQKFLPPVFVKKVYDSILKTRGLVLFQSGKLLKSYYHADCGGHTEEAFRVWGGSLSLGTVKEGSCPLSPHGHWTFKISQKDLETQLKKHFQISGEALLSGFQVSKSSPSGRVSELSFQLNQKNYKMNSNDLRKILGYKGLKSTKFKWIQNQKKNFQFWGQGHGHGVGMCQWGSQFLASRGVRYRKILNHYYPKARIAIWKPVGQKHQVAQNKRVF